MSGGYQWFKGENLGEINAYDCYQTCATYLLYDGIVGGTISTSVLWSANAGGVAGWGIRNCPPPHRGIQRLGGLQQCRMLIGYWVAWEISAATIEYRRGVLGTATLDGSRQND